MKIAMVYPSPESEKGISNYSKRLIESMRKKSLNVDSITYTAGKPTSFFKILQKLKKYDIIHLQHEYNLFGYYGIPFFFFLPILSIMKKKFLVTTMHTAMSQKEKFPGSKLKSFLRKGLYFTQNRLINWTNDMVIVHADFFREILVKEYGLNKNKIEIVPHGIIENIKTVGKQKARKELRLKGNVYLIIGNLQPVNGSDIILEQANMIGKTILVATNPKSVNIRSNKKAETYVNLLKKIVKKNKSEKFVRFDFKEIPYHLWWKYLSAADLILLPYRGGIGSGIFSDAMGVEKPVVASDIPYFRWIARDYGCLKIAKTNKDFPKIIKKAMKSLNYKKMKKECKRYFKERSLSAIVEKYKKIYNSLK